MAQFRMLSIALPWNQIKNEIGCLRFLWGMDIFFNGIPLYKAYLAIKLLLWLFV